MDISTFHGVMSDLRSNDVSLRLAAFGRLSEVAQVLGPERVRNELLPYLNEFVDDEDVVILELCHQLTHIMNLVGGDNYLHSLLEIIETLSCSEDVLIRNKAIDLVSTIISRMSREDILLHVIPVLRHLTCSEWYTARIAAGCFICEIYTYVPPQIQGELRSIFSSLCVDEVPAVRRNTAYVFSRFAKLLTNEEVITEMVVPFHRLTKDDQDNVRLLSVDVLVSMLPTYKQENLEYKILPIVFSLTTDKSWRVRYMLADRYPMLLSILGSDTIRQGDEWAECYSKFLMDTESEVRAAASSQLFNVCDLLGNEQTTRCVLRVTKVLCKDTSHFVRVAFAKTVLFLAYVISEKDFIDHIFPVFIELIKDPSPDVRLSALARLECISPIVGEEALAGYLLPTICELSGNPSWRIRLSIIKHIPKLARQLGQTFFETKLTELIIGSVGDPIFSVRCMAAENFTALTKIFGSEWACRVLYPKIAHLISRKSYGYRLTALHILRTFCAVIDLPLFVKEKGIELLATATKDAVVNIRLTSIYVINVLLSRLLKCPPVDYSILDLESDASSTSNEKSSSGPGSNSSSSSSGSGSSSSTGSLRTCQGFVPCNYQSATGIYNEKPLEDIEEHVRAENDEVFRTSRDGDLTAVMLLTYLGELVKDSDADVAAAANLAITHYKQK